MRPLAASSATSRAPAQKGHGVPRATSSADERKTSAIVILRRLRTIAPIDLPASAKKLEPAPQQKAVPSAAISPAKRIRGECGVGERHVQQGPWAALRAQGASVHFARAWGYHA